jgi:hypothetical protein
MNSKPPGFGKPIPNVKIQNSNGKSKLDELVKSQNPGFSVIPAKAGIQLFQGVLDPGFRRGDDQKDFLRIHQLHVSKNRNLEFEIDLAFGIYIFFISFLISS